VIEFTVEPAARLRVATFTGTIDDAGLMEAYGQLIACPDYDPTLNDLADLSGVGRFDVSADALRGLIALFVPVDRLGHRTRLAIVAAADSVFGMARMYEMLRMDAPEEICVFRDMAEAREWLGA
jgi:hypothetical protein